MACLYVIVVVKRPVAAMKFNRVPNELIPTAPSQKSRDLYSSGERIYLVMWRRTPKYPMRTRKIAMALR